MVLDRAPTVTHSVYIGGALAGWIYAHLLGFGHPSLLQRFLHKRKAETNRFDRMSVDQLMSGEIDPLLEKIARDGIHSLTRKERKNLAKAREKILEKTAEE
jgi:hypothetical protein